MATEKQIVRQRDFSGGEVVEHAKRRDDEAVVRAALRTLRNTTILASGAVEQRPGRSALFQQDGRVDDVRVAPETIYRLCFGNGTLTIRDADGAVVARAWGYDWTAATANEIVWDLFNRDVVICFPGQVPKIARWDGDESWTFLDWEPTETSGGRKLVPFVRFAAPSITMALSALTGSVTVTFSDDVLDPNHVGVRFRYYDKQIRITSVANAMIGTAEVEEVLRGVSTIDFTADITSTFAVGDVVEGATSGGQGYLAQVGTPGTDDVTMIHLNSQSFSFVVGEDIVGPTGSAEFSLGSLLTTGPAIAVWDEELMSDFRGWPRSVKVDQSRLIFSDFPGYPEAIAWSAVGDHFDFASGSADDAEPTDAMVEFAPKKARVYHVADGADEFVFTDLGIYYIPISESNPLRPGSVSFRRIPGSAASKVAPVSTAQGVAYVNAGLSRVMAIVGTGQTAQPYIIRSASDLHSHLFSGVVCLAVYGGDGAIPDELVFAVNGDGSVVVGRYQPGKEWVGWQKWDGEGEVKWVNALGGNIMFSVDYDSGGLIEAVDPERYLDAAVDYDDIPAALSTGAQADVLLHDDQGTAIGDMTSGAGLAAAFDGVTAITSVSLVTSATAANFFGVINFPSGIQAGDLLVYWQRATDGSTPATSVPDGFTSIVNFTAPNTRALAAYKVALGNESGTALNNTMDGSNNDLMLYVFRANLPLTTVAVGDINSSGGDTDPADQVVNVSGLASPLIVFGCYASSGAVDPRSFSTTKDGEIAPGTDAYLAYKIYNSAPADTTIGMDDEGNANCLASFYIQVAAPAAQKSASTTGAVGKTFGQPFKIAKAELWPPTGVGFTDQANVTISMRAKQGSAPTDYANDGTQLFNSGSMADTTSMQTLTSNDENTEWDHAWALLTIASGITYAAELRFYSPGLTHDTGELWFLAGETLKVMDGLRNIGARAIDGDGEVVLQEGDAFTDETFGHAFGDVIIEPFVAHMQGGQSARQTMRARSISDIAVAVQNSTGYRMEKYNPKPAAWEVLKERSPYDVGEDEGAAPPLREETRNFGNIGSQHDPRVRLVKDAPGPLRVLEIGFEVGA